MSTTNRKDLRPSMQWYPQDWRGDIPLQLCSISARGLWLEMLNIMWTAPRRGHLEQANGKQITSKELAKLVGESQELVEELLAELSKNNVFSRTKGNVIFSRRMVRDETKREQIAEARSKAGKRGAKAKQTFNKTSAKSSYSSSSSSSSSSSNLKPSNDKNEKPIKMTETQVALKTENRPRAYIGIREINKVLRDGVGSEEEEKKYFLTLDLIGPVYRLIGFVFLNAISENGKRSITNFAARYDDSTILLLHAVASAFTASRNGNTLDELDWLSYLKTWSKIPHNTVKATLWTYLKNFYWAHNDKGTSYINGIMNNMEHNAEQEILKEIDELFLSPKAFDPDCKKCKGAGVYTATANDEFLAYNCKCAS